MKKVIAILLSLVVMSSVAVTAFAANETSASTTVSYTVEDGYIINIPSSINLNDANTLEITASKMHTDGYVWVRIDTDRTAITDNTLCLDDGTGKSLLCDISVGRITSNEASVFLTTSNYRVATFEPNNTTPTEYGKLFFNVRADAVDSGVYTGTIYFVIGK